MTTTDATQTFDTKIYSQKLSWVVARYLLEASPLSRGFQVRGHGYVYPVLRADAADLERLLRRDLPEMTRLTVWEYSITITSTLPEVEVLARLRVGDPGVPRRSSLGCTRRSRSSRAASASSRRTAAASSSTTTCRSTGSPTRPNSERPSGNR